MECGRPEAEHVNPESPPGVPPSVEEDPRVSFARDALRYYDRGQWADPALLAGISSHLAAAVRQLLDVIDEKNRGDK
jgi:hypothetical protein